MKPAIFALAALGVAACTVNIGPSGPDEHDTQAVEIDKSEMGRVTLKMGVGELTVDGGSPKMVDADFTYNIPSWKPVVRVDSSSFRKQVDIAQPDGTHGGSNAHYKWNVRLSDTVPLDVVAHLGAGEAKLNLGTVNLRSLEVHMGVGEVRVDLRGKPSRDYNVSVHGGVGQATIYLPRDVGVVANATGGIGGVDVQGLEKRNGNWINPAHENAPVTIHVDVKGGVGQIRLIAD